MARNKNFFKRSKVRDKIFCRFNEISRCRQYRHQSLINSSGFIVGAPIKALGLITKNMKINNLTKLNIGKIIAPVAAVALIVSAFWPAPSVMAGHTDVHIAPSVNGTAVLGANGSTTVLHTFSPDIDLASSTNVTLTATSGLNVIAYYGVDVEVATTSNNVHWRIVVDHDGEALTESDVTIAEVGTYDDTRGRVRVAEYNYLESSGNLVLDGMTSWNVGAGDVFTNIDEIIFADGAPLGNYTVTRSLVNSSGSEFNAPFSFTVNLMASGTTTATTTPDTTPPSAPTVTFPILPHSTSTNPIVIAGTAESDSSIAISGGSSTTTATTSASGNWSASVALNASSTNNLSITAMDAFGNVSAATTISITHFNNPTSTPATSTPPSNNGGGNSGGGGGGGGGSRPGDNEGITRAASVTPTATLLPGQAIGLSLFQNFLMPPGQVRVLGATTIFQFVNDLRVGMSGPEVFELQSRLTQTGYYSGPITGYFGNMTRAAVQRFQRAHGLPVTGQVDAQMRLLLNS